MNEIPDLNNRAAELMFAGRLDDAGRVLDRVAAALARRGPAPAADIPAIADECFYACHRAELLWRRKSHRAALPFAARARELEDALYEAASPRDRDTLAFSVGAWVFISVLTGCKEFERAERVFADALADEKRFAARRRHRPEQAESILLAGLCVFFEAGSPDWMERGRPLVAQAQALAPAPANPELRYGYASFHARVGEKKRALEWLRRALDAGVERSRAHKDEDFRAFRSDPSFVELTTSVWWEISSDPKGALILVDGVSTGVRTPGRVPARGEGRHVISLSLDGYGEESLVREARDQGVGLSWSATLTSAAEKSAWESDRQRRSDDSARVPGPEEVEKTRAFLGEPGDWRKASIVFERHATYGAGAFTISVRGDGRAEVRQEPFGKGKPVVQRLDIGMAEAHRLLDELVRQAFTELFVGRHTGIPDELYFKLTLVNRRGEKHAVGKFGGTEHHRFDALASLVRDTVVARLDAAARKALGL